MDLMDKNIRKMQDNLQAIRRVAGLSTEELGSLMGVTKQTISNLESGNTNMTQTQYLALSMIISTLVSTSDNDQLRIVVDALLKPDEDENEEIQRIIKSGNTNNNPSDKKTKKSAKDTLNLAKVIAPGVAAATIGLAATPIISSVAALLGKIGKK